MVLLVLAQIKQNILYQHLLLEFNPKEKKPKNLLKYKVRSKISLYCQLSPYNI